MKGRRLNRRGSSLILVVVGAAFLGILGAMILSITYTNIDLKTADNASKKNFYVDEVAVNEVTALLEQYSSESLGAAYTWLLQNYVADNITDGMNDIKFKKRYMMELSARLYSGVGGISGMVDVCDAYSVAVLNNGIKSNATDVEIAVYSSGGAIGASRGDIVYSVDAEGNKDYNAMTLKGVSITYSDKAGYQTNIVTDITLEMPVSDGVDTAFAKYALISDTLVKTEANNVNVTGGVYGGVTEEEIITGNAGDSVNPNKGGIWVGGDGDMTINANGNIVATRANITVSSKANLAINNGKVWAKNIITFNKNGVDDGLHLPKLTIDGITKVQDDLVLKACNSEVKFSNAYYGFSCKDKESSKNSAGTSSAITINAKNVALDFSGLDTLSVFGRAFVSSKVNASNKYDVSSKISDIMTGQTVALKYDQAQYLLPNNKCLKIPMNPIPISELSTYAEELYTKDPAKYNAVGYNASTPYLTLDAKDDIFDFSKEYGKDVYKYLDPNEPVKVIYYQQGTGLSMLPMANFYFNFKDSASANKFFEWNYDSSSVNKEQMHETYGQFYKVSGGNSSFQFKPGNIKYLQLAGDVLYKKESGGYDVLTGDASAAGIASMTAQSEEMTRQYSSVQLNLRENGKTVANMDEKQDPYVLTHFNIKNLKKVSSLSGYNPARKCLEINTGIYTTSGKEAKVYLADGDNFNIDIDMRAGIVIASGNVTVNTTDFEGVIIAANQISIERAVSLNANEKIVKEILDYCYTNGNLLKDYVCGYENLTKPVLGEYSVNYSKSIYFENWRKNA